MGDARLLLLLPVERLLRNSLPFFLQKGKSLVRRPRTARQNRANHAAMPAYFRGRRNPRASRFMSVRITQAPSTTSPPAKASPSPPPPLPKEAAAAPVVVTVAVPSYEAEMAFLSQWRASARSAAITMLRREEQIRRPLAAWARQMDHTLCDQQPGRRYAIGIITGLFISTVLR